VFIKLAGVVDLHWIINAAAANMVMRRALFTELRATLAATERGVMLFLRPTPSYALVLLMTPRQIKYHRKCRKTRPNFCFKLANIPLKKHFALTQPVVKLTRQFQPDWMDFFNSIQRLMEIAEFDRLFIFFIQPNIKVKVVNESFLSDAQISIS